MSYNPYMYNSLFLYNTEMETGNLLQSAKLDLNPEVTCAQQMVGNFSEGTEDTFA